jgi:hypothetical protein
MHTQHTRQLPMLQLFWPGNNSKCFEEAFNAVHYLSLKTHPHNPKKTCITEGNFASDVYAISNPFL